MVVRLDPDSDTALDNLVDRMIPCAQPGGGTFLPAGFFNPHLLGVRHRAVFCAPKPSPSGWGEGDRALRR